MEAVLRLNGVFLAGDDALLRTVLQTNAAADAGIGDAIAFFLRCVQTDGIGLSEDGIHTQVEVFNDEVLQFKDDADIPGISGINIG